MGDNTVYNVSLRDFIKKSFIINWLFVSPIQITSERIWCYMVVVRVTNPIGSVYRYCSSYTQYRVTTSSYNRVVRDGHETVVRYLPGDEVGRVVMIATNHNNPVVGFRESFSVLCVHILVKVRAIKTESAVTGYNNERVGHAVSYTAFVNKCVEITVDVA